MKQTLWTACLVLAAASFSSAQEDQYLSEGDFVLHCYSPEWVEAGSLEYTIDSLYGRVLNFHDRSVDNLTLLDDSIVIYETEERLQRILDSIKTLDSSPDHAREAKEEDDQIDPDKMVVRSYHPQHIDALEFYSLAADLYSREIQVGNDWHFNMRNTDDGGLLIYEEVEKVDVLMERLKSLDQSQEIEKETSLVSLEYQPRFVSPEGLMEGIQSFQAFVMDISGNASQNVMNLSLMRERGLIVIRDSPERVKEIQETLMRLDTPIPQTMMVCQVIRGSNRKPEEGQPLAAKDISAQLSQILPHQYYTVSAAGMLRANVTAGSKLELFMEVAGAPTLRYQLRMRVGSYDAKDGALNLEGCELSTNSLEDGSHRPLFLTSTTIYSGEYSVIGVTGSEPLFLVVQLLPIESH